jgi:hypothetical protein
VDAVTRRIRSGRRGLIAGAARRRGRRRSRRGEAGFTLIELAIATIVMLFAVLLACELLDESGRLLHHSVRRARDPWTLLAAELLRNDLRGAIAPTSPYGQGLWVPDQPLRLDTQDGLVVWGRGARGELVRASETGDAHAYLQDVRDFRWRTMGGGAVEVWARYHVSSPYLRQLAGSLPKADPGADEDLHVLVVARGGGGSSGW